MKSLNFQCGCGKPMDTEIFYVNGDEIYCGEATCDCGNEVKFQMVDDDSLPTRLEGSD